MFLEAFVVSLSLLYGRRIRCPQIEMDSCSNILNLFLTLSALFFDLCFVYFEAYGARVGTNSILVLLLSTPSDVDKMVERQKHHQLERLVFMFMRLIETINELSHRMGMTATQNSSLTLKALRIAIISNRNTGFWVWSWSACALNCDQTHRYMRDGTSNERTLSVVVVFFSLVSFCFDSIRLELCHVVETYGLDHILLATRRDYFYLNIVRSQCTDYYLHNKKFFFLLIDTTILVLFMFNGRLLLIRRFVVVVSFVLHCVCCWF